MQGYSEDSMVMESLDYFFINSCTGSNPLDFLVDIRSVVAGSSASVENLTSSLDVYGLNTLAVRCGMQSQTLNETLTEAGRALQAIDGNLKAAIKLTRCSNLNPILQDVFDGSLCTESVDGAAWMFASLLTLTILGFIMLSTRAALYNPLIPAKKKKRREKEFRQYKKFMDQHGYDTSDWALDIDKKAKGSKSGELQVTRTFDTEETESIDTLSPKSTDGVIPMVAQRDDDDSSCYIESSHDDIDEDCTTPLKQKSAVDPDLEEDGDHCSCSVDTDDSSINAPPSVVSSVATNLSMFLGRLSGRTRILGGHSGHLNESSMLSSQSDGTIIFTPTKEAKSILGDISMSHQLGSFVLGLDSDEIEPLTPSPRAQQYRAPKKAIIAVSRTRVGRSKGQHR